ncbi:class A beta-lactamase, subclass A2 [Emticicia sp. CRIBPO]|uniref:class A beta-lactamase, subclass A2 n=1 Tax=Emticicia sp. CRIBPO TaxID=2683258 RepID=UPI001412548B|nr:class A beta-lactamase, subclass A2 [Emticicia sp. CRIBPO]NBA88058.1 class A beta-lactamase, subclass A2 [Emticicia sp. CRIBPO]
MSTVLKSLFFRVSILTILISQSVSGQSNITALRKNIQEILNTSKAKVGVAVLGLEDRYSLTFYPKIHFPMQSTYKFPVALAILDRVDKGKLKLDQKIHVSKSELHPDTWSPMREKYPEGNVDLPLSELLAFMVSQSDNNACDILFAIAGGPKKVDQYVKALGVKQIAIAATEYEMHQGWEVQYTNWCEPWAMMQLLDLFHKRKLLKKPTHDFLWKTMVETTTGPKKIKGLLPKGTLVAHKTGSSGTNKDGVTAASHDVGIVTLPDGKHFGIVVLVGDSKETEEFREALVAKISKATWDYYVSKK